MKFKKIVRNKYLKTGVKLFFTLLCFFILFLKIDLTRVLTILKSANLFLIVLAILLFVLSKYISAVRLQQFFNLIQLPISTSLNLKLYLAGMYYNLFLPGGVGGDGYKAYYLKRKNKEVSFRKILLALIFDRLNGLVVLCILIFILFYFIKIYFAYKSLLIVTACILSLIVLFLLMQLFIRESIKKYFILLFYSFVVQCSQLLSGLCLIFSLHTDNNIIEMSFVFLISTITVMIPVTIGGTGLRELTFAYFSDHYFCYDKDYSVTVALLFFVITCLVSLTGMYYSIKPEKLKA